MLAKGQRPVLPPLSAGAHLVGYLLDAGPVEQGPAGPVPLSHTTLRHWQDNVGLSLPPWQIQLLRQLSAVWVQETERARNPLARAPGEVLDEDERQKVGKQLDKAFAAFGIGKPSTTGPRHKRGR